MRGKTTKKVLKYTLLPGIFPRAKNLFASGFGYIAFLMASIYGSVRLLPPNHPYLQPKNMKKFGIHHVIGEAANRLVFKKENADQILIFFTLVMGLVLLVMQFVLMIYAFVVHPALAQSVQPSIFETQNPTFDVAFMLLDHIFGVPDLFGSCVNAGIDCTMPRGGLPSDYEPPTESALPLPFHVALHSMFKFYSIGLLLVGVIIFLYFILVVVAETATTGTTFGQRFENGWVPLRLVVALGLLVPINHGLSSGQYITLYAAKMGSGFATTGWIRFNNTIADNMTGAANPTGEEQALVALPSAPSIAPLAQAISLAHACAYAYWKTEGHWYWKKSGDSWVYDSNARIDDTTSLYGDPSFPGNEDAQIKPYLVKNVFPLISRNLDTFQEITSDINYGEALNFYDQSDIIIRFGRRHTDIPQEEGPPDPNDDHNFGMYRGGVEPVCGEIRIPIFDAGIRDGEQGPTQISGAEQIQSSYFEFIKQLWFNVFTSTMIDGDPLPSMALMSHQYTEISLGTKPHLACIVGNCDTYPTPFGASITVPIENRQALLNMYQPMFANQIVTAWNRANQNAQNNSGMSAEILARGWGGAGIWYNKIAEMNGVFTSAVLNLPEFSKYPMLMQKVLKEKQAHDSYAGNLNMFEPTLSDGKEIKSMTAEELRIARVLNDFFLYWNGDGGADQAKMDKMLESNAFKNIMNLIFGTNGLFDIRDRNVHIHPLAQLTAVGKALVDSTIKNIAVSSASAALGGALGAGQGFLGLGKLSTLFGDFLITTAFVGVTAGFVLFYVLPFLPFVYFYFAVGSWLKSIFEAMVGVPLWALAHLRISGEGLPGEAAQNGYFLILEIFLRPILSVFGLIASLVIFTAQVRIMNFIWSIVTDNLAGGEIDPTINSTILNISINRGIIDEFFYTIIYTIIMYMLATASFKLIDRIPDNILRWTGAGVSAFSDINQDPVEGLTKYAALGGLTVGQKTATGIKDLSGGIGQAGGQGMDSLGKLLGGTPKGGI